MSDTKNKVFEDEFMDVQSGLISLCMELVGNNEINKVYAYCSIEGKAYSFNAFFGTDSGIKMITEIESNMRRAVQFLRTGCHDLEKIKDVCTNYEMPVPTEIKMYYDVKTGKFNADYKYEPVCIDKSAGELFDEWKTEIKQKLGYA